MVRTILAILLALLPFPRGVLKAQTAIENYDKIKIYEDVVVKYVEKTRGWNRSQYTIKLTNHGLAVLIYEVYFLDGNKSHHLRIGGGKSFEIGVNTFSGKVTNEVGFE